MVISRDRNKEKEQEKKNQKRKIRRKIREDKIFGNWRFAFAKRIPCWRLILNVEFCRAWWKFMPLLSFFWSSVNPWYCFLHVPAILLLEEDPFFLGIYQKTIHSYSYRDLNSGKPIHISAWFVLVFVPICLVVGLIAVYGVKLYTQEDVELNGKTTITYFTNTYCFT